LVSYKFQVMPLVKPTLELLKKHRQGGEEFDGEVALMITILWYISFFLFSENVYGLMPILIRV
jgi:hypothetical protein